MRTRTLLAAAVTFPLLTTACSFSSIDDGDESNDVQGVVATTAPKGFALPPGSMEGGFTIPTADGFALPACSDPSGFCMWSIPAPTYLPPRGAFDADSRGLVYISYRPEAGGGADYYTALRVDYMGRIISQSRPLPGRPSVKNPVIYGNSFVFGEGTRNVVMDVTGATSPYLTSADPYTQWNGMHPNGGVILGDGRFMTTTDYGGSSLGVNGSVWAYPLECGPTAADMCQRPATDHAPGQTGYLVSWPGGVQRVQVGAGDARTRTYARCNIPANWARVDPNAPLASAPDVVVTGGMHAVFRLTSGQLIDCRDDRSLALNAVWTPSFARDYELDSTGALWVAPMDHAEITYRSRTGTIERIGLTTAQPGSVMYEDYKPVYVKILSDDSVVVLTRGNRFLRIKRAS
jgi:hypothetical protein